MCSHRFDKYEFRDAEYKRVALTRKQGTEREALPLFTDQVTIKQIDVDEEMTARRLQWEHRQATDHKRRADKWREA